VVSGFTGGAIGGSAVNITIRAIDKFSKTFDSAEKSMAKVGAGITAVGVAGAVAVGGLIKMAGQFEQTQIAFTTMLGSAEEANKLLKDLADFAARTPFTIPGIEQNAKLLLGMGVAAEDMIPTLKALGDVSAGLSVPLDRIALNFGQIRVQGKLTGRELRDFAVAGVPLIAELAKNFGLTEAAITDMVSKGEIGFDDVENAFITMTSEGGRFFDLMDAQSKTFLGQVSNIQDSFIKLARIMGNIFLPAAKFVADKLAIIIGWFEQHPTIAIVAAVLLGVGTALALIIGPLLIMVAMLPLLIAGFGTLSAVSLPITGAILLIGIAIAALIAAVVILMKKWDSLGTKTKILLSIFTPFIALPVLIIKNWGKISAFFVALGQTIKKVWNGILTVIEISINGIVKAINFLIRQLNRVPGVNIGAVGNLDLSGARASLNEIDSFTPDTRTSSASNTTVNIENIFGTDPQEISNALSDQLNFKQSL
jgi:tape measure domain-containing protein